MEHPHRTTRTEGQDVPDADLTRDIIGAGIAVHRELGPGLLESIYRICLVHELRWRGLAVDTEKSIPLSYRGCDLGRVLRLDLLVADRVIVELKAVHRLEVVHAAQLRTYLRLAHLRCGLLINFNTPKLIDGIRRIVNGFA